MTEHSLRSSFIPWPHVLVGAAMVVASGLAIALTPTKHAVPEGAVNLERMIPKEFGRWKHVETGVIQMDLAPRDGEETTMDRPYDQALMRTYVRDDGAVVMLALAYGRTQRQEVKVHRPELCYIAQGFEVRSRTPIQLRLDDRMQVSAYRLVTGNDKRAEPVTYWIRIGDRITRTAWESRIQIFREGLQGKIPDGLLVRASSVARPGESPDASYGQQEDFLRALWGGVDSATRQVLAPSI
jgi:EpsI family protein